MKHCSMLITIGAYQCPHASLTMLSTAKEGPVVTFIISAQNPRTKCASNAGNRKIASLNHHLEVNAMFCAWHSSVTVSDSCIVDFAHKHHLQIRKIATQLQTYRIFHLLFIVKFNSRNQQNAKCNGASPTNFLY